MRIADSADVWFRAFAPGIVPPAVLMMFHVESGNVETITLRRDPT
jgi:hypothetical protein